MRARSGVVFGVLASLSLAGCFGGEFEAAIVTDLVGKEVDGYPIVAPRMCASVVPDGHEISGGTAGAVWSLRTRSSWGEMDQQLYIRPPGMPDVEVDENTGALAMEWAFDADSFSADHYEIVEIEGHHGETIFVSHWGADPDCEEIDPPDGYESPG